MQHPLALRRWEGTANPPRARRPVRSSPVCNPSRKGRGVERRHLAPSPARRAAVIHPPSRSHRAEDGFVFSGIRRLSLCVAGGTIAAGIVACLIGCAADRSAARNPDTAPIEMKDDAGNIVHLARPARRILSLVPSATQTLIAIGATGDLVGRTRYDHAP